MKKFFGVILVIAGILWTFLFLITAFGNWTDFSGASIAATVFFLAIGFFVISLGKKLAKSKKTKKAQTEQTIQKAPQSTEEVNLDPPIETEKLSLKDVRKLVEDKVADMKETGYQVSVEDLKAKLMSLNGEAVPFEFSVADGKKAEMIGRWKLADAEYLDFLGIQKNKLQEEFNMLLKFDAEKGELRCKDQLKEKSNSFGLMGASTEFSSFSGKTMTKKKEIVIGRKPDGTIGKVVDIALDTTILKDAIQSVAEKSGWKIKRVVGKL